MIAAYEVEKLPQGYYKKSGTVLKRKDSLKEGQSLLLFLRDLGPRWVSAPGASSGKSRFGGATEPLMWGEYCLYQSPRFLYLKEAEVREDFITLRSEPHRLLTALGFYRRVSQVVMTAHESDQLLKVLWSAMVLLRDGAPPEAAEFRFSWRLLNALGLAPSLQNCVKCGALLDDGASWTEDGLLCPRCSGRPAETGPAELAVLTAAGQLSHEKFLVWSKSEHGNNLNNLFNEHAKKLLTFFREIR